MEISQVLRIIQVQGRFSHRYESHRGPSFQLFYRSVQSCAFLYFCHSHPEKSPKLDCLHSVPTPRLVSSARENGYRVLWLGAETHSSYPDLFWVAMMWQSGCYAFKGLLFPSLSNAFPTPHYSHQMGPLSKSCSSTALSFSQLHQYYLLSLLSQWKSHLLFPKASLFTSFNLEPPSSCFLNNLALSSSVPSTHRWAHLSSIFKKTN